MVSNYCLIVPYGPTILAPLWDISLPNLSDLDIDLSRSLRSNVIILLDSPYMLFYHCFTSNIFPILAHLSHINLQNLSDLDIYLSRSLKVKCKHTIGLSIYPLLLLLNSNIRPNSFTRYNASNLSDLDFDLSRPLRVKCDNVIWLPISAFH